MLVNPTSLEEENSKPASWEDNQNQEDKPVKTSGLRAKKERKKSDIKERKKETWLNLVRNLDKNQVRNLAKPKDNNNLI